MTETRPPEDDRANNEIGASQVVDGSDAVPEAGVGSGPVLLGVFSTVALYVGLAVDWFATLLASIAGTLPNWLISSTPPAVAVAMPAVFAVLLFVGKSRGNVALAKYAKGALWTSGAIMLLILLAWGSCMVPLGR